MPSSRDGHQYWQVVFLGSLHILGAEGRGGVHQAGAVLGGYVIFEDDEVGWLVWRQERKQRVITLALELLALV